MDAIDKLDSRYLLIASIAGVLVFVASFFAYAFSPSTIYIATFAIGVIILVVGYVLIQVKYRTIKRSTMLETEQGLFVCLDEYDLTNDAVIETMERMRCLH